MFCEKCGAELPEGSKFCGKCGQKTTDFATQATVPQQAKCPRCGSDVNDEIFCQSCGFKLTEKAPDAINNNVNKPTLKKPNKLNAMIIGLSSVVAALAIVLVVVLVNQKRDDSSDIATGDRISSTTTSNGNNSGNVNSSSVEGTSLGDNSASSSADTSTIPEPTKIDYFSYYDPINDRTGCFPDGRIYIGGNDRTLHELTLGASGVESERVIPSVKADLYSMSMFVLDNYVFQNGYTGYHGDFVKSDIETGMTSTVVPSNPEVPRYCGFSCGNHFVLSNDNKIYGMIITVETGTVMNSKGELEIQNIYYWNLIRVNDDYSGYTTLYTFSPKYDFWLLGVYDGVAYYQKSNPDTYSRMIGGGTATTTGDVLGFYSFDISKQTENKVFDCYFNGRLSKANAYYQVLELDGEVAFLYIDRSGDTYHCYVNKNFSGWKDVFNSKNDMSMSYNSIQLINNKLYIALETNSYGSEIYYEIDGDSQRYLGIGDSPAVVVCNPVTGKVSYIDGNGNINDFK